jgi:bifunctional non-homologous end joining protein LigD
VSNSRDYTSKRSFDSTPEPVSETAGDVDVATAEPGNSFVIHQHYARRLHHDLRLEMMNGVTPVLVSWAVPKGLPHKKGKPHLAIHVEDHPFEYGEFEGSIPAGNYGAGEVRIFDSGTYELLEQETGKLSFRLQGRRLKGVYHLHRTKDQGGKESWLAFLRRDERPEPEPVPDLAPMLASSAAEAFDNEGWIFEPKWDGVRTLAVCGEDTRLFSRRSRDVSATYPELGRLHDQLVALGAVLDGEVVALQSGAPSFERLQSRINLQGKRDIERAVKALPVTYIAFDILYLDGSSLLGQPLEARKEALSSVIVPSSFLQVSPCITGEGVALAASVEQQRMEGIVAKRIGSPYRPGKRTREWLKIKIVHDADVVVGGWTTGEGARASFGALLVGAYSDRGLEFLGAVGTGFTQELIADTLPLLEDLAADACPFTEDPTGARVGAFGKALRGPQWVEPVLVGKVEYRELTSALRLRAPAFKGFRADKAPRDCRVEDLEQTRRS